MSCRVDRACAARGKLASNTMKTPTNSSASAVVSSHQSGAITRLGIVARKPDLTITHQLLHAPPEVVAALLETGVPIEAGAGRSQQHHVPRRGRGGGLPDRLGHVAGF